MKIQAKKTYKTIGGDVVYIIQIEPFPYGIQGKFLTRESMTPCDTWDDTSYPYLISQDTDEFHFALTDEEVTIEESPEYFL